MILNLGNKEKEKPLPEILASFLICPEGQTCKITCPHKVPHLEKKDCTSKFCHYEKCKCRQVKEGEWK